MRRRIEFAAVSLKVACAALDYAPGTVGVAFAALAVQALYVALWGFAAAGFCTMLPDWSAPDSTPKTTYAGQETQGEWGPTYGAKWNTEGDTDVGGVLLNGGYFFLILSLYWGIQLCKAIVHCITAGAVGWWWFRPEQVRGHRSRGAGASCAPFVLAEGCPSRPPPPPRRVSSRQCAPPRACV